MAEGQWIGRSPHGPVVSFPAARTEEEARVTAWGAYGDDHNLSIEWSDHPDTEVLLCDFDSNPYVVAEFHTSEELTRTVKKDTGTTIHVMDPVWTACFTCRDDFVRGDLESIARRSAVILVDRLAKDGRLAGRRDLLIEGMSQEILALHREVREKWDGRTVPLIPKGGE